jgi:RNA polymerase subunit RPABC4/transcription elongation factor Spt4
MPAAKESAECPKCKRSLPPQHSGPCPYCGSNVLIKRGVENGIAIDDSISLEATTRDLTDKEFEDILRTELKQYMRDKLGPMKVTKWDTTNSLKEIGIRVSQQIPNPEFASVVASYIGLRSQEQQASSNNRLQLLIAFLALGTFLAGVLSVLLPYLHPP